MSTFSNKFVIQSLFFCVANSCYVICVLGGQNPKKSEGIFQNCYINNFVITTISKNEHGIEYIQRNNNVVTNTYVILKNSFSDVSNKESYVLEKKL